MKFTETKLSGAYVVTTQPKLDERGRFARTFCDRAFASAGLDFHCVQANRSTTGKAGTVRGLHFQVPPSAETKLVQCLRGRIYDVIVDVRPQSPTFLSWFGIELAGTGAELLFVPPGVAHGFITLTDDVELLYMVTAPHDPECERGLRHDDPALGIRWPIEVSCISQKDRQWPLLNGGGSGTDEPSPPGWPM